jgi:hypothetical protein
MAMLPNRLTHRLARVNVMAYPFVSVASALEGRP